MSQVLSVSVGFGLVHCGAIWGCWLVAEIPVHRVEELHGLLVGPYGVDEDRDEGQASEEEQALGQGHIEVELLPLAPGYPPHVVGQHHPAVEHVDHHPLVGLPKVALGPTRLQGTEE